MLLGHCPGKKEPQSHASDALGGEKRIRGPLTGLIIHSRAIVFHREQQKLPLAPARNLDQRGAGIHRIFQQGLHHPHERLQGNGDAQPPCLVNEPWPQAGLLGAFDHDQIEQFGYRYPFDGRAGMLAGIGRQLIKNPAAPLHFLTDQGSVFHKISGCALFAEPMEHLASGHGNGGQRR